MNMKIFNTCLTVCLLLIVTATTGQKRSQEIAIIPQPVSVTPLKGSFRITPSVVIRISSGSKELGKLADWFNESLKIYEINSLKVITGTITEASNTIDLIVDEQFELPSGEGYLLEAGINSIRITSPTPKGVFYGLQSLLQLMPEPPAKKRCGKQSVRIPACSITDYPRFPYRGMHLDVGRHIFPTEFIKKYIDLMAAYKINTFHWHLTEDQGWRLEIKKYPLLTEVGAWRSSSPVGRSQSDDNQRYGGFYTQEEARDIVAYAAARYVNVIPEIEMPGHSLAALAAYPHLSCTGGPHEVWTRWGVNENIFCAGNDEAFAFLENVLLEVLDIFPSKYIHIGGDEAPKERWNACEKCQKRIRENGLKDSHELQSYFIKRIEKFLNGHGRQIIGWDEILEGGLAPGATVMSWQGMEGGIEAARQGHDVIMSPGSHCYLNFYQGDPAVEPLAFGGFNTLKNTYSFNPVPEELNENEAKHIIGVQANVWTEYIKTPEHIEYMAYPRAIALAEVNWSPAESRDWNHFIRRFNSNMKTLDRKKVNYSLSAFNVEITTFREEKTGNLMARLKSDLDDVVIRYALVINGVTGKEKKYRSPFEIKGSTLVKAWINIDKDGKRRVTERFISVNDATGLTPVMNTLFSHNYAANGPSTLTDGLRGDPSAFRKDWLGFLGDDADFTIDLGKPTLIQSINAGFLHEPGSWIHLPTDVEIEVSDDGYSFRPANGSKPAIITPRAAKTVDYHIIEINENARFIRVRGINRKTIPEGKPGAGYKAWLFIDEVQVNPDIK